jgi:predicted nucleic-acid-binding protein
MAAVDTNVLVRFLVQDDPVQLAKVLRLFKHCIEEHQPLFVPITVVLELEWVLRASFKRPKDEIVAVLSGLLSAAELTLESEGAIEVALGTYADGTADFSDCVHVALAIQAGHAPLRTFDKAAAKIEGASLLT